ncbi:MAG: hypothetical protein KTR18_03910, partial [Acidiferrobacterales bacterium]|nr:hypothetical protein [Acidiferrobacterales bacterium]
MHFLRLPYQSDGTKSWIYFSVSTVIGVCLLLIWQLNVFASDANGFGPTFKTGHVYARGILLGQNGQPIFAEYNEQGQVVQQYGEAVGEYEGARIISADDYKFQYARYLDFLSEFRTSKARAANILTREEYIGTDFPAVSLPDINGQSGDTIEVPVTKPVLAAGVQSVLVRNQNTIVTRDIAENDLVLFSATIDLRAAEEALGDDAEFPDQTTKSLLLNSRGQILHRSSVDIGLRTAFWNRQDGSQFSNTELDGRNGYGAGDTPIAPISEALVYPDMQWHSRGHTDENGQFSLYYFLPPCPGFSWFYDYNLIGEIPYRNFNPKSRAWQPWAVYYTTVPVGDRCDGTALNLSTATDLTGQSVYNTLVGINASSPQPIVRADMPVVANMITGIGMLTNDGQNPVELGERTEYAVNGSIANTPTLPENLDLDANEVADDVRLGEDGKVEVRFDGDSENPDFTRLVDTVPDFSSQGLLKTLKPEDLSDTDLYVYRQSTGQLLVDREGLRNEEYGTYNLICAETDPDCVADGEDATNRFFYQMLIRGRWYFDYLAGALPDYQSKTRINEELRGLDSNHLRPGEEIKLVAINRKTGYIGTALAKVKVGGVENNALSFDIPPLMLQPPNLKIEAKRTTEVEAGLTRGEERQYTIGSEGAGLTSDKTVVVTTEWVDQDGSPLPKDLPGYTGRLVQVIDTNELGVPTSKLSNFAIRPGRRTQIIRLTEDDELGREHFYIHVSGEPIDGNPSFARVSGAGEGPLLYRPDYYVPIRVPIFDEEATRQVRNELRYAQKEELTNLTLDDIDPVYHWPHRPEMQFSVFDLDVNRIAGLDESEDGVSEDIQTIIYDPNSLSDCERDSETLLQCFLNNADVVTFEYALFSDSIDPLPTIGPDRTLVLSLGGEEVTIGPQYGADQTIRFEDPEHLRHLDAADYLTIALFQNNDAENLLWEFDLVKAALVVDQNRDG